MEFPFLRRFSQALKITPSLRKFSLYPTQEEIHSDQPEDLEHNVIKGPYISVDHYLEVHYRLFREDFLSPIRLAIKDFRGELNNSDRLKYINNIRIYSRVKFLREKPMPNRNGITSSFLVNIDVDKQLVIDDWEESKRFMIGSLLFFTNNNFKTFFLATVCYASEIELKAKVVVVDLADGYKHKADSIIGKEFLMAECVPYFDPYFHVMNALKDFNSSNFPLKKYIVDVETRTEPPQYLKQSTIYNINMAGKELSFRILNDSEWPSNFDLGLDPSQYEAFKAALTNDLVVIQGPPGTGKTFLGLEITKALLQNYEIWSKPRNPILIVCHTNHALDQFLEGLLPFTSDLVRIGTKGESCELAEFNLREIKQKQIKSSCYNGDSNILMSALVVGTTTHIAARERYLFEEIKPKIVIVEEAAEVLEAHVIASLTESCQHLILIGDHKQLRPHVTDFNLAERYHLDVSLFERMVNNGLACHTLTLQHRMRPEISKQLVPTIYPILLDHPSVQNREKIRGMDKNVYFMTHLHYDEDAGLTSKQNEFEADIVLNLAKYLVKQDYSMEDITILTTYKGQHSLLIRKSKTIKDFPSGIKITTVDNYQGEENKIVLLSLVRSCLSRDIGFLKTENRICVALSRARDGLYIVGNLDGLVARSSIWQKIKDSLQEQEACGPALPLRCEVHTNHVTMITKVVDFCKVSHGGCSQQCKQPLPCGHLCRRRCHYNKEYHEQECREPCTKSICRNGHKCQRKCHHTCGKCEIVVTRSMLCGHNVKIPCHKNYKKFKCQEPKTVMPPCRHSVQLPCYIKVKNYKCMLEKNVILPCGHNVVIPCYRNISTYKCKEMKQTVLPTCGHRVSIQCHINLSDYQCKEPKEVTLPACGHRVSIPCSLELSDYGVKCEQLKETVLPQCGHTVKVPCNTDISSYKCNEPTRKVLPACGHHVILPCSMEVGAYECNKLTEKVLPICGHYATLPCKADASDYVCKELQEAVVLSCGHIVWLPCSMEIRLYKCTELKENVLPCGHRVTLPCGTNVRKYKCREEVEVTKECSHKVTLPCYTSQSAKCVRCQQELKNGCSTS